ncbi:hypothetical protein RRG08_051584 [Elysia crispata]|uniref:Uncharacterized protein n=1 Tax=Elysia crispata TaxID=231223 RepID=A0AAE1DR83_9GAST|nr:hypothetical protein RRG08_051584 [Elysia crispata]
MISLRVSSQSDGTRKVHKCRISTPLALPNAPGVSVHSILTMPEETGRSKDMLDSVKAFKNINDRTCLQEVHSDIRLNQLLTSM